MPDRLLARSTEDAARAACDGSRCHRELAGALGAIHFVEYVCSECEGCVEDALKTEKRFYHQAMIKKSAAVLTAMFGVLGLLAGCSSAAVKSHQGVSQGSTCAASRLQMSFSEIPGSQGAGNVVYVLKLHNANRSRCTLSGAPTLKLLGAHHNALSSRVISNGIGKLTTQRAVVPAGANVWLTTRFSPDVPGVGETGPGQCEPTAYDLVLSSKGFTGSVTAAIKPSTPVCEHGQLQTSVWAHTAPKY